MVNQKSLANLKPFKVGDGRKRGQSPGRKESITGAARLLTDKPCPQKPGLTYKEAVALSLWENAIAGEIGSVKELLDRLEGKLAQPVSGSLELNHNISFTVGKGYQDGSSA